MKMQNNMPDFGYLEFSPIWTKQEHSEYVKRERLCVKNPDALALGCSFTSGSGLPIEWSWPSILATCHGVSINNCAYGGSSVKAQVDLAFEVMQKYGIPKKIYCFLPDLERNMAPILNSDTGEYESTGIYYNYELDEYISLETSQHFYRLTCRNRKKTKAAAEVAVHDSILALRQLYKFCKIVDIELQASSWCRETVRFLEVNCDDIFASLLITSSTRELNSGWSMCRWFGIRNREACDHYPTSDDQAELWDMAEDHVHPGLHAQIHFAEHFSQKEITQDHIEKL